MCTTEKKQNSCENGCMALPMYDTIMKKHIENVLISVNGADIIFLDEACENILDILNK